MGHHMLEIATLNTTWRSLEAACKAMQIVRQLDIRKAPYATSGATIEQLGQFCADVFHMPWPEADFLDRGLVDLEQFRQILESGVQLYNPRINHPGSQYEEDRIIAELLPNGHSYLDIGANDPCEASNTMQLYKRGWRGVLIEPLPWMIPRLNLERPRDFVLPVAALDYDGVAMLRVAGNLSTLNEHWPIHESGIIPVPCMTLSSISMIHPHINRVDYCSIDVEGSELRILSSVNWEIFHPRVISIEHVEYDPEHPTKDTSSQWRHILEQVGYREVARTPCNLFFKVIP